MSGPDRMWPVLRHLAEGHVALYRATGGLVGRKIPGGPSMLLLEHVGAKSGAERTTPLVYATDGEDLVIVASKGGHPQHPAWFHNLMANPDAAIQIGSERRPVRARVADAKERERLWPVMVAIYGGYEGYQQRTDRQIPLVILEPRAWQPDEARPGEVRVGPASELPPGTVTGAGPWAVGNDGGDLFAVSRRCRHLFADLAGGRIDRRDGCLVCPWHGSKYDVETGRMVRGPQGGFEKVPGLDRSFEALTRVLPLRRGDVIERDGVLFVRDRHAEPGPASEGPGAADPAPG